MVRRVVAFTDLYYPTINGVTHTVSLWKTHWNRHGGTMSVVFPAMRGYEPNRDEYPIRSIPAPLYSQYRLGLPFLPSDVPDPDIAHVHSPFSIGITGLEVGRSKNVPVVGSYHTMLSERVRYFVASDEIAKGLGPLVRQYERWFFDAVDFTIAPTHCARSHLRDVIGLETDVEVISNGVDTEFFSPTHPSHLLDALNLSETDNLVGYTGRHSPEKNLVELIEAVHETDLTLLLAGDGPSRPHLEHRARVMEADVRFLGVLEYDELPAFYSALDVFAFPSVTETQGLVAMEAMACGTPVVAADARGLSETVQEGETGYLYQPGDIDAFRAALFRALEEGTSLRESCLERRPALSVDRSMEQLRSVYERLEPGR